LWPTPPASFFLEERFRWDALLSRSRFRVRLLGWGGDRAIHAKLSTAVRQLTLVLFIETLLRRNRRQNMDEVTKIKEQISSIWAKAKEAQGL
jgi:hypothetical protein